MLCLCVQTCFVAQVYMHTLERTRPVLVLTFGMHNTIMFILKIMQVYMQVYMHSLERTRPVLVLTFGIHNTIMFIIKIIECTFVCVAKAKVGCRP